MAAQGGHRDGGDRGGTIPTQQSKPSKGNLNRAQTKRWVEAKTHTYDEDDWGWSESEPEDLALFVVPPPHRDQSANESTNDNNGAASSSKILKSRQKERRWVEAKRYTYDDDDWGASEWEPEDLTLPKVSPLRRYQSVNEVTTGNNGTASSPNSLKSRQKTRQGVDTNANGYDENASADFDKASQLPPNSTASGNLLAFENPIALLSDQEAAKDVASTTVVDQGLISTSPHSGDPWPSRPHWNLTHREKAKYNSIYNRYCGANEKITFDSLGGFLFDNEISLGFARTIWALVNPSLDSTISLEAFEMFLHMLLSLAPGFSIFTMPFIIPRDVRATFRPQGDEPRIHMKEQPETVPEVAETPKVEKAVKAEPEPIPEVAKSPKAEETQETAKAEPMASTKPSPGILTDLVRDSRLDTRFGDDGGVVHVSYVSTPGLRRKDRREERWKRLRILGRGSFGQVWLQECDRENGSKSFRAVKEMVKEKLPNEDKAIDYTRELEAIAKFSHPKYVYCFVESFGWYESDSAIFITMEYMENGNLQEYLSVPFPEAEVKEIVSQLLEGLSFMHENGFAHRDLKPANVLVSKPSPNWWVKISDFGISKRAREASTVFDTVVGTNGYLAPEVMGYYSPDDDEASDRPCTVAVDLWSLGALTYRLLTNQNIFTGPGMLGRYVVGRAPFPKTVLMSHAASEACIGLLEKMMAPSPLKRPTATEALEDAWICDNGTILTKVPTVGKITRMNATNSSQSEYTIISEASASWPTA